MVGLAWRKCALHIHTPCSHDVEDDEYTVEELLDRIEEKEIEVVGITDHNNCEFIDKIIAENRIRDNKFVIFPGVEITSSDGIHFLVYFDINQDDMISVESEVSKTRKHIRDFLSELGIHEEDYFDVNTKANKAILGEFPEIERIVKKFKGFLVFAHVKSNDNGLFRKAFSSDFVQKDLKEKYMPFECKKDKVNELLATYPGRALILHTDFHHLEDYDSYAPTYIKFGANPTIDGLKQIMYDPKLRICYEISEITHPHITELSLDTKYFQSTTISFSPYLNVIIGGRGSGKSVIIEIISYLLRKYPYISDLHNRVEYCKKMDELFSENDKMSLDFYYEHQNYRLQRFFSKFQIPKGLEKKEKKVEEILKKYDSTNTTTLFQWIEEEWKEIDPKTILPSLTPHLFTQTAVASIPKQMGQLIQIIEGFSSISTLGDKYFENKELLSEYIEEINILENELENLYNNISEPEEFNYEIQRFEQKIKNHENSISNMELKNKQKIDVLKKSIELFLGTLKTLNLEEPKIEKLEFDYIAFESLQENILDQIDILNVLSNQIFTDINNYNDLIGKLKESLQSDWKKLVKKEEKRIRDTGINWQDDESQINQLITDLKTELTNLNSDKNKNEKNIIKINKIETHRTELIEKIENVNHEIMDFLEKICNKIQCRIKINDISLKSIPTEDQSMIRILLDEILKGVRGKDEKIESIINEFSTKDIFALIVNKDELVEEELQKILSDKVIERFKKHFDDKYRDLEIDTLSLSLKGVCNKDLLEIERCPINPCIEYKLKKGDEWKEIKNLSPGERCALLIALILIEHSSMIIIDQPEDELDYKTRKNLVEMIKEKKNTSQIIMITHYQNIPVLADADTIILMDEIDKHGVISKQGCFEDMKDELIDMEGGPEAIRIRFEKYKL